MRLPILFKVGLGLVMGSWALDVFSNSHLATSFYRNVLASFPLTAFSAAIHKQSPMLFDIAGFSSLYTWIPVLVCMGVGFIASSILCFIAETIISWVYEFIKGLLPISASLIMVPSLGYDLYCLPKSERKERFRQACQRGAENLFVNLISPIANQFYSLTTWCITALVLGLFVARYCPSLMRRIELLQPESWFMGSALYGQMDFHLLLTDLLHALFGW